MPFIVFFSPSIPVFALKGLESTFEIRSELYSQLQSSYVFTSFSIYEIHVELASER